MTTTAWLQYGHKRIINAYQSDQDILQTASDLAKTATTQSGRDAFNGAIIGAIELITKAAKAGSCNFRASNDLSADLVRLVKAGDGDGIVLIYNALVTKGKSKEADALHSAIFGALEKMRRGNVKFLTKNVKREDDSEGAPIKIEIVSMPDRITTTELVRDSNDNIKTSVQLEKDTA